MDRRCQLAFLALVMAQAAHSIEEYAFALYDVLPVARFASSLVSTDPATGLPSSTPSLWHSAGGALQSRFG